MTGTRLPRAMALAGLAALLAACDPGTTVGVIGAVTHPGEALGGAALDVTPSTLAGPTPYGPFLIEGRLVEYSDGRALVTLARAETSAQGWACAPGLANVSGRRRIDGCTLARPVTLGRVTVPAGVRLLCDEALRDCSIHLAREAPGPVTVGYTDIAPGEVSQFTPADGFVRPARLDPAG